MRFRTRAFLLCFLPFALLLTGSFWAIQSLVQSTVRNGLRGSLRENHLSIARLRSRTDLQNSRFLKVVGENAALKAGMEILLSDPSSASDARRTVEDQLRELCERMGFDFLLVSGPADTPLAGVIRKDRQVLAIDPAAIHPPQRGLLMLARKVYQIASVPIDQGDENLGTLSVGEVFDFSGFTTPAVLIHDGKAIDSNLPGIPLAETEKALAGCSGVAECDVRLGGASYISLPLQNISFGDGYVLRSLQDIDSATAPLHSVLNEVFITALGGALLAALAFSLASSRSIVKPISALIEHLKSSESTGLLREFQDENSSIREIRDLTSSFNRAAASISEARQNLQRAYLGFIGALASALDARDRYTSGHSHRVSELAGATAVALGVTGEPLEEIRVGALLHDIGKIGVPDSVLQKPGRLTDEEFDIVKQHPGIGRRILEGVNGFVSYLGAVEFHHENWDGSGYPAGQQGEQTPLAARIIHVADAYDAMTTDRPYRRGMSHDEAMAILRRHAGTQFDPRVVDVFASLANHLQSPDAVREMEPV
ncbi:MAG TPA: HD-GYP domain-containing protein [Bryobacteraceae bacterium]|jgi:HD-GYP domain-containing protein (c-di-GMP phosphodiesterase class II)|nr:HD-GYP domain-containing protein [Bryobacteraceae bacterium]